MMWQLVVTDILLLTSNGEQRHAGDQWVASVKWCAAMGSGGCVYAMNMIEGANVRLTLMAETGSETEYEHACS